MAAPTRSRSLRFRRRLRALLAVLAIGAPTLVGAPPAGAAIDGCPWHAPVGAPVVDGFRPPAHTGAPGNRGWEYRTVPGTVVTAAGTGRVAFAGTIAGQRYVSIDHPCGLRTTYSYLASVSVRTGDPVAIGAAVGTAGDRMHFGLRSGSTYLDPGLLFAGTSGGPPRVRLVKVSIQ